MQRHDVHVDPIEAQEVVRLAAERQSADAGPTVNGLAEALGLPREEVERLLAEVRAQRGVAVPRRRIFGDRSAALSAALALALILVTAGGFFVYRAQAAAAPADLAAAVSSGPAIGADMLPPPVFMPPRTIIVQPGTAVDVDHRHEEIERLVAEIERIRVEKAMRAAAESTENLERQIAELRAERDRLKSE
ncbi:hypothetical protein EON82_14685 [bacterium]|nr:MAG: hypothetical protein EON82_14685 [bacterium]